MNETEECKNCIYYDRFTDWDSLVTYPCPLAKCNFTPKDKGENVYENKNA